MAKIGSYLYLSDKDALRAEKMFEFEDFSACGRFCEQSVEKSLKAFIEIKGSISDKSLMSLHKPRRLYERCCELGLETPDKQLALELSVFSEYYYDTNYPGASYFELTETQAIAAMEIMRGINKKVSDKLNEKPNGTSNGTLNKF